MHNKACKYDIGVYFEQNGHGNVIFNKRPKHLETIGDISFQQSSQNVMPNHWLFTIRTRKQKELLLALNEQGIMSRPFWMPMSTLPMYENCTFVRSHLNISKLIHEEALSIPCSTNITDEELKTVVGAIETFFE